MPRYKACEVPRNEAYSWYFAVTDGERDAPGRGPPEPPGWSEAFRCKACEGSKSETYSWYFATMRAEHNAADECFWPAWVGG
jgi:hypothetical protein